jgi:PAS domain S-box-containing protein
MSKRVWLVIFRYGLPVIVFAAVILLAFTIKWLTGLTLDPTALLILVLIASAWYGGRGPGFLVMVAFEITIFYFSPPQSLTMKSVFLIVNRLVIFLSLVFIVSSRRRAQNRIEEERERLQVSLSSIGDAVIAADNDGIVNFLNPAAESLTGWTTAEAAGKPLGEIFRIVNEYSRQPVESPASRVLRDGLIVGLANHTILLAKDGREVPIADSAAPIRLPGGKIVGVILVFRDVSEDRSAEKEREELLHREQEARREAEEANRTKDEFLATLSHELRTPLNALMGWSRLIQGPDLDEQTRRRGMEVIDRSARNQLQLIEDILDVSRLISGKLTLTTMPLRLETVIETAVDSVRPAADGKEINLQVKFEQSGGIVLGDAARLQQVISNLLVNAIKFTPHGGNVWLTLLSNEGEVRLTVRDSGCGIKAEFLPYIFDRFRQQESVYTRRQGGLGLGLSLVRQLVELHGGRVEAHSEGENKGATFTVTLPLLEKPQILSATSDIRPVPNPALPFLSSVKVLIVEDDLDSTELLRVILENHGAEVRCADRVSEALDIVYKWAPQLLVSDIGLPGEDGFSLIRKVRSFEQERQIHIPAIALTGFAGESDEKKALESGYQLVLTKPMESEKLIQGIKNLVISVPSMQVSD